ncbi:damage-inducible protein CinA [Acinetobacter sp. ANC 5054]|uniref:CinA family protein n=1 Tax=Acinetobacter sp. ANC 5054 TaxID=1977877 RepID=UPI000A344AFC|nr:CinA family protein [Acinetobacter sp. ANC 5054]OTG83290.1 damage-inducible protein CinA [Acinetobacter sp. ANC 5054]
MLKQCCDALEQRNLTVAFIESASSGYLCSQFSIYKNSGADILLGGLISYDPSIKREILKVSPKLIEQYTAESQEVTEAMAKQGKLLFSHANFVVACTGLLKPGGSATIEKPEGTFYISIYYNYQIFNYDYSISGTPLDRLNILTEHVAENILTLLNAG